VSNFQIFTDGGARGNPGEGAIGVAIFEGEKQVEAFGERIGVTTNNIAEYTAVLRALEVVNQKYDPEKIDFMIDSELVVRQLNGIYKIKNENLKKIYDKIMTEICKSGANISFAHIRREQNKKADSLVNEALDKG